MWNVNDKYNIKKNDSVLNENIVYAELRGLYTNVVSK